MRTRSQTRNRNRRQQQQTLPVVVEPCNLEEPIPGQTIVAMADRTMEELLRAPTEGYGEAIVLPEINADHFEIKTNLLQLVQANPFHGLENENPHAHINSFKRITSTLRFRNVPNDVIKLMMFPYSLEGAAKTWFNIVKELEIWCESSNPYGIVCLDYGNMVFEYWTVVGPDFCIAVKWFFDHGVFAIGCNSSFVALIPKVLDPKVVSDYRPISLIGSLYKVVTKILASRLSLVISDLISDVQTAFLPNRQILDGPFIINEILARCKLKKQQAMIFKVDFAKAYDSVRWDYLDDVLISFGFGPKWRSWIRGSLSSGKASILVNGIEARNFLKDTKIDPSIIVSFILRRRPVFIDEFFSSFLVSVSQIIVWLEVTKVIGCLIMKAPFKYLGILVGDNMSSKKTWDETINKMKKRLSRWKLNTLSVGGRLTLLKSVLGSTPIYNMSIFKVPKSVLNYMESLRRNFFNGIQEGDRKIAWVKWSIGCLL
ncbi:RNA-directed DNA polymerase, eukaryota [Tanacetum coccineum]